LHIRTSKGRARLVPFRSDLAREFRRYWPQRLGILRAKGRGPDEALFIGLYGRPVTLKGASEAVRRLLRQLGLKGARGRIGPRPYDLRHAFAVHRLTAWYRDGVDIHARLPWLSAYMGHVNVLGTEVYLHATPQLLKIASDRFAKRVTG
jgi:integrase